jgi:hypothetical protein
MTKRGVEAAFILFAVALAGAGSSQEARTDSPLQEIDWTSITAFSPIPDALPTFDSDDPLQAGFSPQWIERSLMPGNPDSAKFAQRIISQRRAPADVWARNMQNALWTLVHTKVSAGKHARVFCNAIGCLCYVELDVPTDGQDNGIVFELLLGADGRTLKVPRSNLGEIIHYGPDGWELTIIRGPIG